MVQLKKYGKPILTLLAVALLLGLMVSPALVESQSINDVYLEITGPETVKAGEEFTVTIKFEARDYGWLIADPPILIAPDGINVTGVIYSSEGYCPYGAHYEPLSGEACFVDGETILLSSWMFGKSIIMWDPGDTITWEYTGFVAESAGNYDFSLKVSGGFHHWFNNSVYISPEDPLVLIHTVEVIKEETLSNTIVLIPGIMGTEFFREENGSRIDVWLPRVSSPREDTRRLQLTKDGEPINELILGNPLSQYYSTMYNELNKAGYDVHYFGYDWRMDNDDSAQKLKEFIDGLETDRVNIVAHSMGGLVAARYIGNGNENKVDKLITLGTPYLGAPKTLYTFERGGVGSFITNLIVNNAIAEIAKDMKSVYQLLPSSNYFSYNKTYYLELIYNDGWFKNTKEALTTHIQTEVEITKRNWFNLNLYNNSKLFHNQLSILDILDSVDSYLFVGDQIGTIGKVTYEYKKEGDEYAFNKLRNVDEDSVSGDGTVPVISANIGGRVNKDRIYYIRKDHTDLMKDKNVITQILNILKNQPDQLAANIRRTLGQRKRMILKFDSPVVDIHVFDPQGNHLGPVSDIEYEEEIPFGSYYLLDDTKIVFLDLDIYDVSLVGTGEGEMTFKIQVIDTEDEIETTVRFDNIPITSTTVIETNTYLIEGILLLIDIDGDGITDFTVSPSVILDKYQSNDDTPPVLSYVTNGTEGENGWYTSEVELFIEAEDDSSGVNRIEYTFNMFDVLHYEEPLMLSDEGIYQLYAVAIDNNQNNADALFTEVRIDKEPPVITLGSTVSATVGSTIEYSVEDNLSGVRSVTITLNGHHVQGVDYVVIEQPGDNMLEITAVDHAGNITVKSVAFYAYIPANITVNPPQIKATGKDRKIDLFVTLPNCYELSNINTDSIILNEFYEPVRCEVYSDMAVFQFSLPGSFFLTNTDYVPLMLKGEMKDGLVWKGDTRVIVVK